MKIIPPSYKLSAGPHVFDEVEGLALLRWVELNARISHKTEEKQTADSWNRFISAHVIGHGDWSVTEHATVTATFTVNRGITHELVRHRLFSFTQESTRFVNYVKPGFEARYIPSEGVAPENLEEWIADLEAADACYRKWLCRGYAPQIARDHLPNALAADIAVTGNLRNWRLFFLMRTTKEAHVDCRTVAIPMLAEFQRCIPLLYDDIVPNAKQSENLMRAR